MSWTVYILRCGDGSLYTGITTDLTRRLEQHRSGRGGAYTRSRRVRRSMRVLFAESRRDRAGALRREAAIKRLPRSAKLALIRDAARA